MQLPPDIFRTVVENTPLVAIDLIVTDRDARVLVGLRTNNPAKGYWFVPGGRINKNESLHDALARISKTEFGIALQRNQVRTLGVYDHMYLNNTFDDTFSTHYVTIGCTFKYEGDDTTVISKSMGEQHEEYEWMSIGDLLAHDKVHDNVKRYFQPRPDTQL